ncbi:hypothetical protein HYH02_001385 [Chlamydomonas schloesseri]|uniref:Thioredoxin domain-containing protein n=1 Tax=Chlamydomonas schloesseri TaxID=2026947 RepID=A0A835WVE6_9CHLO|nr:hypothetical protein HYH02_001385 [Chlamydomonas schloesseri]|eukprot:KAG2454361.1 hypothetical protein HYH02_001385 [Chlamydomonas schloesseri]
MRQQRFSRLQALARQWLTSSSVAETCSTSASTSSPYFCPILAQQRFALQRRAGLHTSRWLAAEHQTGAKAASDVAPVSMRTLILALMAGAGVTYVTRLYTDQKLQQVTAKSQQVVGQASVGGPFELTNQDGKPFSNKDLLGEFALLYFGFTHCPDICPDELEKVAEAINSVEKATGVPIQLVFISVDPQRDTPALIKSYVQEFHPRMVGLTGSMDKIKAVSKAYRVYYNKTGESDTDYLVDHSIIHYLISPEGEFVTFFGKNADAPAIAKQISQHVADWQAEHPGYHKGRDLKALVAGAGAAAKPAAGATGK